MIVEVGAPEPPGKILDLGGGPKGEFLCKCLKQKFKSYIGI